VQERKREHDGHAAAGGVVVGQPSYFLEELVGPRPIHRCSFQSSSLFNVQDVHADLAAITLPHKAVQGLLEGGFEGAQATRILCPFILVPVKSDT